MDRLGVKERYSMLIELLQASLGIRDSLSHIPSDDEWDIVNNLAVRHGIAGVLFGGLERLPKEQRPHKGLLLKWFWQTECYCRMYGGRERLLRA